MLGNETAFYDAVSLSKSCGVENAMIVNKGLETMRKN
jgi:hypothetical protein